MSFKTLADQARTDPILGNLDQIQVSAVINVLALMMYADKEVRAMEETEFRQMLGELPWLEGNTDLLTELAEKSIERVKKMTDELAIRIMIRDIAMQLGDPAVREKVFSMAATLAWADMELHPDETKVLQWLAATFGLDYEKARAIVGGAKTT